ncbi:hypothetical protein FJTKL_04467 [Diaporthe vaccinii]|uniref:Uncharacterized protein n=1 Tax=Diaporthe vaccinii TaxID=105482 RepID=A0ABR4DT03_9PEZI
MEKSIGHSNITRNTKLRPDSCPRSQNPLGLVILTSLRPQQFRPSASLMEGPELVGGYARQWMTLPYLRPMRLYSGSNVPGTVTIYNRPSVANGTAVSLQTAQLNSESQASETRYPVRSAVQYDKKTLGTLNQGGLF